MPTKINCNDQSITQYSVLTGGANNLVNNVPTSNSGYALTSGGAGAQPSFLSLPYTSFSVVNTQVFSSPGTFTYTPTANMKYCIVEVVGAGGGGGKSLSSTGIGTGGGAGAYSRQIFSAATIGASQSLTVGLGGAAVTDGTASSFGSFITCGPGLAGYSGNSGGAPYPGGVGGTVTSGGTFNVNGGTAYIGVGSAAYCSMASDGGRSYYSAGGASGNTTVINGSNGRYGSGGGGGLNTGNGGIGGNGIIVITEFI